MRQYRFLKKKTFEKLLQFETRINEEASRGWKVVSMDSDNGVLTALLEKEK